MEGSLGVSHKLGRSWALFYQQKISDPIFLRDNSENCEPSNFLNKSEKIGSSFLVQLAGQISEINIQKCLIGSQFPKFKNWIRIPEIFLTFFVGKIKPRSALAGGRVTVIK